MKFYLLISYHFDLYNILKNIIPFFLKEPPPVPKMEENGNTAPLPNGTGHPPSIKNIGTYRRIVKNIKKYSFWLFAFIFITFLIAYGTWLLTASNYYDWDPSEKYNALPLEDEDGNANETNRLFTKEETTFRPTAKKKTVESTFRFKDIFKNVIFPKLEEVRRKQRGGVDSEEEASEEYEEETGGATAEVTTMRLDTVNATEG